MGSSKGINKDLPGGTDGKGISPGSKISLNRIQEPLYDPGRHRLRRCVRNLPILPVFVGDEGGSNKLIPPGRPARVAKSVIRIFRVASFPPGLIQV